jgi:hypothetical protein
MSDALAWAAVLALLVGVVFWYANVVGKMPSLIPAVAAVITSLVLILAAYYHAGFL